MLIDSLCSEVIRICNDILLNSNLTHPYNSNPQSIPNVQQSGTRLPTFFFVMFYLFLLDSIGD